MILTIPYQALEICNIHITQFQADKYGKNIARLSYKDPSIDFHDVSILTPPVKVIDYNSENSRLQVDLSDQTTFQIKINTLQEYLASTFFVHQQSFVDVKNETRESIHKLFHFLLDNTTLNMYIFPTAIVKKADGSICKVSDLVVGDTIRCVLRIQGISKIQGKYGVRLRIQHSISAMWLIQK